MRDGHPRSLAAGRGPRGQRDRRVARPARRRRRQSWRACSRTSSRMFVDVTWSQEAAVWIAAALVEFTRVGGFLQQALAVRDRPACGSVGSPSAFARREFAADRFAAALCESPHGLADIASARAGERADRVRGQPRDGAALRREPVRRARTRGDVHHASEDRRTRPQTAGLDPNWKEKLRAT